MRITVLLIPIFMLCCPIDSLVVDLKHETFPLQGCFLHYGTYVALDVLRKTSDKMTLESCQQECALTTYKYFGVRDRIRCYCGRKIMTDYTRSTSHLDCNQKCPGNPMQFCGSQITMAVYMQPEYLVKASLEHKVFSFQGCYFRNDRNFVKSSKSMTIDICQQECSRTNRRYFGVANANECFCDDQLRGGKLPPSWCGKRCPGNLGQICGDHSAIAVYEQPKSLIKPSAKLILSTAGKPPGSNLTFEHKSFAFQGCFVQTKISTTLRNFASSDAAMTTEACQKQCALTTYRYFGVKNGTKCYCDDELRERKLSPESCALSCPGNPKQSCGDAVRIVVYEQPSSLEKATLGHKSFTLQGCYPHVEILKTLNNFAKSSPEMTIESCQQQCAIKNHRYFGVADKTECYCDDKLGQIKIPEAFCQSRCPGDPRQICGGFNTIVVYQQPKSKAKLQGCYFQVLMTMALQNFAKSSRSMTIETCQYECKQNNYRYFGISEGIHCFCDNSVERGVQTSSLDCDEVCPGNSEQFCGGKRAITVYEQPSVN